MPKTTLPRIASIQAPRPFILRVCWADGGETEVDVAGTIETFRVFAPPRADPALFEAVKVGQYGTHVAWTDDIDMAATTPWRLAQEQSGAPLCAGEFRNWRKRQTHTLDAAAKALGVSRWIVAYYDKGERILRTVGLALATKDMEMEAARRCETRNLFHPFGDPCSTTVTHRRLLVMAAGRWLPRIAALVFCAPLPAEAQSVEMTVPLPRDALPPIWLQLPSGDQFVQVYPDSAQRRSVSGKATLDCLITAEGSVADCHIISEAPPDFDFGEAALRLCRAFKAQPARDEHGPFATRVSLPIRFTVANGPTVSGSSKAPPELVTSPIWSSAPTFAQMSLAYPAGTHGGTMTVDQRCVVRDDGHMGRCETVSRTPPPPDVDLSLRALRGLFRVDLTRVKRSGAGSLVVEFPITLSDPTSEAIKLRRVDQPIWTTQLDPSAAVRLFPKQAADIGLTIGHGRADCIVGVDGALTGCTPGVADPPNLGFSEAAVQIAQAMRMNLWTAAGGPVDGARITLPVRLELPTNAGATP